MKQHEEAHASLKWFGLPVLFPYLKRCRKLMISMLALSLLGGIVDIFLPFFPDIAITRFIEPKTLHGIGWFIAVYAVFLVVQTVVNGVLAFWACKLELTIQKDLKNTVFFRLQELSISFYNQNSVGYLHSRALSDTDRIGSTIAWGIFFDAMWNFAYVIGAVAVMLALRPSLALCVIALLPVMAVISFFFQRKLVKTGREVREINSRITGNFNEGITGAMTVKTLGIEKELDDHFKAETANMRKTAVFNGHLRGAFMSLITFMGFAALALVLWQGGRITEAGLLELGTLSVFMSYALNIMEPVRWAVQAFSDLINLQVNIERVHRLLTTVPDVADTPEVIEKYGDSFHPKKENWEDVHGDVEFEDVTFRYPDGDVNVLEHFNLKVPHGTMVAIVGETGAGKSTLVNLICRFFEPTEGRVLLDGRDLRERSQLWLHSHIGYVLQTPHLFSGSIRDNLTFGRPDVTEEELDLAVKRVHADWIVARMKDGYDADVGEGGSRLSGGERQLLSFARALIADPAIFVLDEATSSIDTETEAAIQKALTEVLTGRTSFVIAHRLSTIRSADIILLVDDGKIVERGTHDELMAAKGAYWRLYTRQYELDRTKETWNA